MSQSLEIIAKCPKCDHKTIYEGVAKRPRITCKECKTRFYVYTQKTQKKENKKSTPEKEAHSPTNEKGTSIDENWFEMEDPELSRHTYRDVLLNKESTVRERLEAASKLVDLKYKSGTLDVKTQSEKEVMSKFRQHDTQTLVSMLNKSSQKELS